MKKLYTIATAVRQVGKHGGTVLIQSIERDEYGKYPPVYSKKDLADKYLDLLEDKNSKMVVKLDLIV